MMTKTLSVSLAVLACLFVAGNLTAQTIGAEVGKPLKAAQEAMQKKRWDEAMVRIKEAQAVRTKSAFEQYSINELQAYVLLRQGDTAGAVKLYEQNLNSGQVPPGEVGTRTVTLTKLAFQAKNYAKTIEYGTRWIKGGGANDPEAHELIAQSWYLQRDYRNAAKSIQGAIDAARRSGKPVKENWLLLKLNCYYSLKDEPQIIATREQLVRSFPNP